MLRSRVLAFTDPFPYQAAIRAAQGQIIVTAGGDFRAELTQIDLPRLWLQRGRESLPRVLHATLSPDRAPIGFLAGASQAAVRHSGLDVAPGDIIVNGSCSTFHRRTSAPCHWAAMSLTPEDLSATAIAIADRDLAVPSVMKLVRPAAASMLRLLELHAAAGQLAKAAPDMLTHPEVARALEHALLHAMIACLTEATPVATGPGTDRHSRIIARLEELLAANHGRPLYLAEICTATGASERALRACCQEHLGMGPIRYLWLRRMHLAHRALMLADPTTATVTGIATEFGFWELGRFSVEYRTLFGEQPSASLRRPPDGRGARKDNPFDLTASESA